MKIKVTQKTTNYVEIETPLFYSKLGGHYHCKIHDNGIIKAYDNGILNYEYYNGEITELISDEIRDILETGTPITEEEFKTKFKTGINYLNKIAS